MKKFYLLLLAIVAFVTSATAATKVIYSQDFETAIDAAAAGWASPSAASGLSIGSDGESKVLVFKPTGNDRSAHTLWGADLINAANVSNYTVSFEFNAFAWGNNHTTTEFTLMSDEQTCTKKPNGNYTDNSTNWLFDLTQLSAPAAAASGSMAFKINGDESNVISLASGKWYHVDLSVNVDARTVDYQIITAGEDPVTGTYEVPEEVSMIATGLYFVGARYTPTQYFDNISVTSEVDGDFANVPTASLSSINQHQRVYLLGFKEGETLHVKWNGVEKTYDFGEADPNPVDPTSGTITWSNNSNYDASHEGLVDDPCESGTLEAWATSGNAESEHVSLEVSNELVPVSQAVATISAVKEGYGKTYTLTADNSTVELAPALIIDAKFVGKDASQSFEKNGMASGETIELPGEGTLTMTTKAFGYSPVVATIENNIEYTQKADYNFAHWTEADITKAGFTADGNVAGNYATYGRLYWYNSATYDASAEANEKTPYSTIPQFTKKASEWTDSILSEKVVFTAIPSVNVHIYQGVGLVLDGRKGDAQDGNWISSLYLQVNDLTSSDFIMKSSYNNYGSNALHPIVASEEEFLAQDNAPVTAVIKGTETVDLYRISDCIARIQVFSPVNSATGIKNLNIVETADPSVKKVMTKNGLVIVKGDKVFSVVGAQIK